jgi:diacylglycerol kinase family enzyme
MPADQKMLYSTLEFRTGPRMRRRFLLIHNPIAGVKGRSLLAKTQAALEEREAEVISAQTLLDRPDLSQLNSQHFDAVIAAGGDGTFRALAKALGDRLPIGFLPMGTGNVLAHEIELPMKPAALAGVFCDGPEIQIESGMANGEPFFLMAGAGFDGEVIHRLSTPLKRRIGKGAYVTSVLAALAKGEPDLDIVIDGKRLQAGWIVVTKSRRYGGSFTICRNAGLLSEGLHAIVFTSRSRLRRIGELAALALGGVERMHAVMTIQCRRVEVTSRAAVAVQIDGDPWGTLPLTIDSKGISARLIVPAGFTG